MKELPSPEVYEKEFKYMPWGKLIRRVINHVVREAPEHGNVLDLMCGNGHVLHQIQQRRPDLFLLGVDNDQRYIDFAEQYKNGGLFFDCKDARTHRMYNPRDVVICTAGLHHLPYEEQQSFITNIEKNIRYDGFCIVADPHTRPFSNEEERQLAAAELGHAYLRATIKKGATPDVITAAIDVLTNDVHGHEYKRDADTVEKMLRKSFSQVERHRTWPSHAAPYGDHYFVLRQPKNPTPVPQDCRREKDL